MRFHSLLASWKFGRSRGWRPQPGPLRRGQRLSLSALASFSGAIDGASPYAGLVMDIGGHLYGTASVGGASNYGTAFRLAKASGTITTLPSSNSTDRQSPQATHIVDLNSSDTRLWPDARNAWSPADLRLPTPNSPCCPLFHVAIPSPTTQARRLDLVVRWSPIRASLPSVQAASGIASCLLGAYPSSRMFRPVNLQPSLGLPTSRMHWPLVPGQQPLPVVPPRFQSRANHARNRDRTLRKASGSPLWPALAPPLNLSRMLC
jgi:uncharacterized repeat protein (TIGR03803 family)